MTIHDERDVYIEQDPTPPIGTDLSAVHAAVAEPIEGQLLTPAENAALDRRQARTAIVRRLPALPERQVVKARATVTTKATVRHMCYPVQGAGIVWNRWRDSHGGNRYERMMRQAEISGNHDELLEWETRDVAEKQRRHERMMDWIKSPIELVKAAALGVAGVAGLLLIIGIVLAIGNENISDVITPITAIIDAIAFGVWFLGAYGAVLLLGGTTVGLVYLWHTGRVAQTSARSGGAGEVWGGPSREQGVPDEVMITPSVVVTAFRDLGIADLRKAIDKQPDGAADMLGPITLAGCGVQVDVTLPQGGGDTSLVQRKHRRLAENLYRHEHEVYVTIPPDQARTVRLWIADSGALDEPVGPSPLVVDPDSDADLYTGRAPWGLDLRGNEVSVELLQLHLLVTGLSKQGKTAALRALALWLIRDASVRLWIADLKGVGDWHMFEPIAEHLIEGPTDDHVIKATLLLEAAVEEMEDRMQKLDASKYPDGVPRSLAQPGGGFEPLFIIVDEAQQAFMCPAVGDDKRPFGGTKNLSRYFMGARKIQNQGRAVNVHLWQGTQDPTDQNLPKLIREGAHIRASLVVGTETQGRMSVGDKAVDAGAAPHKLRRGMDKGTLVVTGEGLKLAAGQDFTTVRTHFVNGTEATELVAIAVQRRTQRPTVPVETEDRDLLDDVATVIGTEDTVKATDVVARLRELAPGHADYAKLGGAALAEALGKQQCPVRKTDGVLTVRAQIVRGALVQRGTDT